MWLNFSRITAALAPLPILLACASSGVDPNVITAPELSRSKATSAYDAIRQIRPEMLRTRDPGTLVYFKASRPLVAVDNDLVGGVEQLRVIPVSKIARIEFVNPWKAAQRYGSGFGNNGIMLIETQPDSHAELAGR
jgi:hypothetical protein